MNRVFEHLSTNAEAVLVDALDHEAVGANNGDATPLKLDQPHARAIGAEQDPARDDAARHLAPLEQQRNDDSNGTPPQAEVEKRGLAGDDGGKAHRHGCSGGTGIVRTIGGSAPSSRRG